MTALLDALDALVDAHVAASMALAVKRSDDLIDAFQTAAAALDVERNECKGEDDAPESTESPERPRIVDPAVD